MALSIALILVLIAVFGWGFGDFFIQKSVRKIGNWETLFIITFFGSIILLPFVVGDFSEIFSFKNTNFFVLLFASFILFLGALLDFEALKRGKLAVVEPIWSLEIIVTTALAFLILKETINLQQGILIISLIIGLVLVSLKTYHLEKKIWLEKGVFLAILSAIVMGSANFFIGFGSRESSGIIMNWFLNSFIALACLSYLVYNGKLKRMMTDIKSNKPVVAGMCLFDNAAWLGFAYAMSISAIGITVALSESYILIAVLLGVYVNKESIRTHQKIGLVLAIASAIILALISY